MSTTPDIVEVVRDLYDEGAGFATVAAVADVLGTSPFKAWHALERGRTLGLLTRVRAESGVPHGTGPYLYFPVAS